MATNPVYRVKFTPVDTIPSSLDQNNAVFIRLLKNVEVWVQFSDDVALQEDVTLLKWIPEANAGAGAWYPYRNPQSFDTTKYDGKFMAAWNNDIDNAAWFQLLVPDDVTVIEAFMQGVKY